MPLPPTFEAKLVRAEMISKKVRELVFERVDGAPMSFDAGQWVSLVIPTTPDAPSLLRRSYSIASAPEGSSRFEIAVTHVEGGPGSHHLHSMEVGSVVTASGPQGFFTRGKTVTMPALFIATGTGVTPLRSMMRAAITSGSTSPIWLIFGVRDEGDLLYRNEFAELARSHANIRVEMVLSRPTSAWSGRSGYVQHHVRDLWTELTSHHPSMLPHAYICGLERMVSSVRELLRGEMKIPREQVHSERYD